MNELLVVSVQNISKSFMQNDGRSLLVLDNVSFNVEQNEIGYGYMSISIKPLTWVVIPDRRYAIVLSP